jgi:hypothetical protein
MPLTRPQAPILGTDVLGTVSVNFGVPIVENSQIISSSYSITTGSNATSAGPISIAVGATLTIPTGSVWTIV